MVSKFRNHRIDVRTTKEVKDVLAGSDEKEPIWKNRTKPDPFNSKKEIPFKSMNEYLEFCIACLNHMPESYFYLFKHMFNPNHSN